MDVLSNGAACFLGHAFMLVHGRRQPQRGRVAISPCMLAHTIQLDPEAARAVYPWTGGAEHGVMRRSEAPHLYMVVVRRL